MSDTYKEVLKEEQSYEKLILEHLQKYGSITNKEAIQRYGMTCFTARMSDLRKVYDITDEYEPGINRFGKKSRYKRYYLIRKNEESEVHN